MSGIESHSGRSEGVGRIDVRRNRASILRAARELSGLGVDPTMEGIARHAGVSVATVYRHFGLRDHVLDEALRGTGESSCRRILPRGLSAADAGAGFFVTFSQLAVLRAGRDRRAYDADAAPEAAVSQTRRSDVRVLRELLSRAQVAGVVRGDLGLEDIVFALDATPRASDGPARQRTVAARRLATLLEASFRV